MTQLPQPIKTWLQSLKINKTFSTIEEFENGYNFGYIFDKLQLTKGKKFKNSSDLACIFQNYKNVRDLLLENFGCDFPVNNIIYRTGDLLEVLREQATRYVQQKKIMTMKAATSIISNPDNSLIHPIEQKQFKTRQKQINSSSATFFNQTSKLPKKIQDIQKKLDKYREEKTRHELVALQQRRQELQQYRRVVMNNRDYEISKTKKTHEQTKQKQKKVYDVWYKTQQIKKHRIETDKQFESFQKQKRNKLLTTLRNEEVQTINKGQEMFQLNCMRQGIQLEHDPDKPVKVQGEFNQVVVMERIKDNIFRHEVEKKERVKRENKKRIEAEQAKHQSQVLWAQINKIDDYSKKFSQHFTLCESTYTTEKQLQAQKQTRLQKQKQKKFIDLPAYQDHQKRQQQFRQRKVEYLKNDVKFIESKWKKQYSMAEEIVEALLQVTIEGEEIFSKGNGFFYGEWRNLEERFLGFQDLRKRKNKDTKLYMDYSAFDHYLKEYILSEGTWKNYHATSQEPGNQGNILLTRTVQSLINISYPDKKAPATEKIPLYMPLKLTLNGPKLSGKSTHTAKLAQKYGILIINPREIIKQALDLARPPVEQDPKKAGKKDSKKVQELTPEKIALKEFGAKLLERINMVEEAKVEDLLSAIRFRLLQNFKEKSEEEIVSQYVNAKQKQKSRHEQALKDFEQAQKKPKKQAKKGAAEVAAEESPKMNQCFYTSGFVIDDFTLTQQALKQLEQQFNGYISEQERINQDALKIKKEIQLVVSIPEPVKDNSLKSGTFDLLISLTANDDVLIKRKSGRKIDPQTKLIYHATFNPAPDIKGFAQKLIQLPAPDQQQIRSSSQTYQIQKQKIKQFYSPFGLQSSKIPSFSQLQQSQQSVQQTFDQITQLIEHLLLSKYEQIQRKIAIGVKVQSKLQIQQKEGVEKGEGEGEGEGEGVVEKERNVLEDGDIGALVGSLGKENCQEILGKFLGAIRKYQSQIKQCLYGLEAERGNFMKELMTVQKKFTSLINRPDDKAGKILGFQQNYNKLLSQRGSVVKDAQASKHLIQRLNQLYDSLWDAIGAKKNEAVEQRQQFKDSLWLNTQADKIVETLKTLLQIQLNYLCETIFIILILSCKLQQKPSDYMTQYLSLGIAPQLEPIPTIEPTSTSTSTSIPFPTSLTKNQRLTYYIDQTNKCLESLPSWIEQKYKKMKINKLPAVQRLLREFVEVSVRGIKGKEDRIRRKVEERVLEERSYFQALVNKMDDWIIQGIKAENDFVYEIYKNIKKCIQQAKKSNVKQLHVRDITETLSPIHQLSLNPIPLQPQTSHRKLPIYSYMIFLEQIKTLTNNEGYINFDIFKKYMDKRKKSQLLHPDILKIDYDTVQQFLVKDGEIRGRELALAVVLWDVPVFDDDQLAKYKEKLLKEQRTEQQKNYKKNHSKTLINPPQSSQSLQPQPQQLAPQSTPTQTQIKRRLSVISAFPTQRKLKLNELVLMDGAFDQEQEYIIKHFIFEIFREEGCDYVRAQDLLDTLSLFDQIQVLRYGDTAMMLNL